MGGGVSFLLLALLLWTTRSSSSSMSPAAPIMRQLRRSPEAGAALLRYLAAISQQAAALSAAALQGGSSNQQQAAGVVEAGEAAAAHLEQLSVGEAPMNGASKSVLGDGQGLLGRQHAAMELGGAEGVLAMACEVVAALLGREVAQVLLVRQRWCDGAGDAGATGNQGSDRAATSGDGAAHVAAWTAAANALCTWAAARQHQQQQALLSTASTCAGPGDPAATQVVSSCAASLLQPSTALVVGQLLALLVVGERMGQKSPAPALTTLPSGQSTGAIGAAVVWALELGWSAMLVCLQDGLPGNASGDQQQWQEVLEVAGVASSQQELLEECWDACCEAAVLLLQMDPSMRPLLLQAGWLQPALAAAGAAAPSAAGTGHKRGRLQGSDAAAGQSGGALAHALWQQSLHLQLLVRALL
jgi:hypothetical protein